MAFFKASKHRSKEESSETYPWLKVMNTCQLTQSQGTTHLYIKMTEVCDSTAQRATATAQLSCSLSVCSALGCAAASSYLQTTSY